MSLGHSGGKQGRRGSAMIEFCFLLPWYVFLFVGAFDFGFYSYSLIATTTAARASAYYCADSTSYCAAGGTSAQIAHNNDACTYYAIGQLKFLPNVGSAVTTCTASPVTLTITYPAASLCPDTVNTCVTATVAYVTPQLIPIPGLLAGQITIMKAVTMRLRTG